jgi:hypothetical protein
LLFFCFCCTFVLVVVVVVAVAAAVLLDVYGVKKIIVLAGPSGLPLSISNKQLHQQQRKKTKFLFYWLRGKRNCTLPRAIRPRTKKTRTTQGVCLAGRFQSSATRRETKINNTSQNFIS